MLAESAERTCSEILAEARVVYLILYVNDLNESREFYENKLGLRVIEADEDSVKCDAGMVIICLQRASDYNVTLTGRRDDSSDVVFLVDDINLMRRNLEKRGVVFVRRRTYEIGLVTDFYDPNGHRLMIYQPSATALSWASAKKLRQVWKACGKGGSNLIGPASGPTPKKKRDSMPPGLDGQPLVYLFLFVPESEAALSFYNRTLGLQVVERVHCCNPACPPEEKGIVKYDVGGMLMTTHHIHRSPVVDDFGRIYSPRAVDPANAKAIVPVFHVKEIQPLTELLSQNGVAFGEGVIRSHIGRVAKFEAPTGHVFYLYEPDAQALKWPTGGKISEILSLASRAA